MTEKAEPSLPTSTNTTSYPESDESEPKKDDFEERLAGLPEKYRDEILRQFDIPQTKITLLSVLGYATWPEILLMIAGSLFSMGGG